MCQPEPHWLSKQRIFCSSGWHIWITKAMFVNRYLPYKEYCYCYKECIGAVTSAYEKVLYENIGWNGYLNVSMLCMWVRILYLSFKLIYFCYSQFVFFLILGVSRMPAGPVRRDDGCMYCRAGRVPVLKYSRTTIKWPPIKRPPLKANQADSNQSPNDGFSVVFTSIKPKASVKRPPYISPKVVV